MPMNILASSSIRFIFSTRTDNSFFYTDNSFFIYTCNSLTKNNWERSHSFYFLNFLTCMKLNLALAIPSTWSVVVVWKHHIFNPFWPNVPENLWFFRRFQWTEKWNIEHSRKLYWKLCEQRKAKNVKVHTMKMMRFIITACCYQRKNGSILALKYHYDIAIIRSFLCCCLRKCEHSITSLREIYQPFTPPIVALYIEWKIHKSISI